MMFKPFQQYFKNKNKQKDKGLKKRYYLLFVLVMIPFMAYNIFMTTNLFVPQQEEITDSKSLFKSMLTEIAKIDTKSDTIIFVYADQHCGCGNNFIKQPTNYEKKIIEINYNKENPYFIDIEKSFDDRYHIKNKKIMVLRRCDDGRYFEKMNSRLKNNLLNTVNLESKFNIYREKHKFINKNKVEINVNLNNSEKVLKLTYIRENDNWKSI